MPLSFSFFLSIYLARSLLYESPDLYDALKYDVLHNSCFLSHDNLSKVYYAVKRIADFVIPQEYGIEREDKLAIGVEIARPLLVRAPRALCAKILFIPLFLCVDWQSFQRVSEKYPSTGSNVRAPRAGL